MVPLANTWLERRAGPLTGLSVAGLSCWGVPRSRGTAKTALSSSSGSRRKTARGPEEGMATWPVGGRGVDVRPKSFTPLDPGVWAPSFVPPPPAPHLKVKPQGVSFPGTRDSEPPALPSIDPGVRAPSTQLLRSDSGIRDLSPLPQNQRSRPPQPPLLPGSTSTGAQSILPETQLSSPLGPFLPLLPRTPSRTPAAAHLSLTAEGVFPGSDLRCVPVISPLGHAHFPAEDPPSAA